MSRSVPPPPKRSPKKIKTLIPSKSGPHKRKNSSPILQNSSTELVVPNIVITSNNKNAKTRQFKRKIESPGFLKSKSSPVFKNDDSGSLSKSPLYRQRMEPNYNVVPMQLDMDVKMESKLDYGVFTFVLYEMCLYMVVVFVVFVYYIFAIINIVYVILKVQMKLFIQIIVKEW